MRHSFLCVFVIAIVALAGAARPARGQAPPPAPQATAQGASADPQVLLREIAQLRQQIQEMQRSYGDRLSALEAQLAAVTPPPSAQPAAQAAPAQPPPPAPVAPPPEPTPAPAPGASSKVFNPDIAVIGNVMGTAGSNPVAPLPALELHEAEVSFQAVIDPYARADFFVSFREDGASLEEGYITFPTIPGGLLLKAGQLRRPFGKTNGLHPHVLPWPDRPLVMRNLVGGDDGLADASVSVARLIPNPWFFLEATGEVSRGQAGDVFSTYQPSDLSYLARLRAYQDLTESTNLDLGTSFTMGHNSAGIVGEEDLGRFTTRLYGVDATVRYKPLRRSIYRSFVGRTELVWSRRQQFDGVQPAFGYYVSGDYQFARRWYTGLRYDRSDRADDATVLDTGMAAVITFWPSEFSQIRGMYRRTRYARTQIANEFLFQLQFAIGAHGAHPF